MKEEPLSEKVELDETEKEILNILIEDAHLE